MQVFIGIIVSFFPILSLPLVILLMVSNKKLNNKKYYAFLFSLIIAMLLYKMTPRTTMDLYRYYQMMDIYSIMEPKLFFQQVFLDVEPLMNIVFYIFSQFGNNNLIIVFTTIVSYAILFYIVFDYQKKIQLSNFRLNIILIYFVSTFVIISNITGIRFCLARLIFFLALYFDLYHNKKGIGVVLLYVLPILIHESLFALLLLRLILFFNKNKIDFKIITFGIIFIMFPNLIPTMLEIISKNFVFLSKFSDKAHNYMQYGNKFDNIYILNLTLTLFVFFIILIIKSKKIEANQKFINYNILVIIISLMFISNETISIRFLVSLISFSLLIMMDFIKKLSSKNCLAFTIAILAISLFYIAFQFIQLTIGSTFEKLIFDFNTTIPMIMLIIIFLIFSKKKNSQNERS